MNGGIVTLKSRKKRLNSHHYVILVECYKTRPKESGQNYNFS